MSRTSTWTRQHYRETRLYLSDTLSSRDSSICGSSRAAASTVQTPSSSLISPTLCKSSTMTWGTSILPIFPAGSRRYVDATSTNTHIIRNARYRSMFALDDHSVHDTQHIPCTHMINRTSPITSYRRTFRQQRSLGCHLVWSHCTSSTMESTKKTWSCLQQSQICNLTSFW